VKVDFHIHTNFSYDGVNSPQEIVEAAISQEVDCLCITDHNETRGAIEALRFASAKPVLVIPGIEVRSREGDILGINVRKLIPRGLPASEVIKEIDRQGGLAVIAHPFAWPHQFKGDLKKTFKESLGLSLAIEVFNASVPNFFNEKALNLVKELNLPFTAGSDAHGTGFVGKAFLELPGDNLSAEQIIEGVEKKRGEVKKGEISLFVKLKWEAKRNISKFKKGKLKV